MKYIFSVSAVHFLCIATILVTACTQLPTAPTTPTGEHIALSWESGHSERSSWSDALLKYVDLKFDSLDKAQDVADFCPKYKSLSKSDKLKAWGEIWVHTAYYESGYNPKSASVDVGSKDKKDTWSIGLWQMSVVDQSWSGGGLKYSYDDLLTPGPNAHLAVQVMARQIDRKGRIVVSSGPYWAVLYRGKYSKVDQIQDRVKKSAPKCI